MSSLSDTGSTGDLRYAGSTGDLRYAGSAGDLRYAGGFHIISVTLVPQVLRVVSVSSRADGAERANGSDHRDRSVLRGPAGQGSSPAYAAGRYCQHRPG